MQKLFKSLNHSKFESILIPNIEKALNVARNKNITIIHVRTVYKKDKSNWSRVRMHYEKMWCQEECWESEFIDELIPLKHEFVIEKVGLVVFMILILRIIYTKIKLNTFI